MARTQIRLEDSQIQWLRRRAAERAVSVSQLIRESIELYRERENRSADDRKIKALAAAGRYSSNRSDVSANHDPYLVEAYSTEKGDV